MKKRELPKKLKRIVVKIGTGVLTSGNYSLDQARIKELVAQIAGLVKREVEVILVSSGAIGAGMGMLKLKFRPKLLPQQQAAAAIGQGQLMKIYDTAFKRHKLLTAQILLTREDLNNRTRYLNAKNTLFTLLCLNAIPIINENDTVSVDEIKFGDNDRLSALVASLAHADLLIMLSDVDGLYTRAPKNRPRKIKQTVVSKVTKISPEIERMAGKVSAGIGRGGMASKIEAARICAAAGIPCVIANGRIAGVLPKILAGGNIGTLFLPKTERLVAKKRWIGFSAKVSGQIVVDQGAKQALTLNKKSLLPKGIIKFSGSFTVGDIVSILDSDKHEFARGLTRYSSVELAKIKGLDSGQIKQTLGYKHCDEVVNRDNLVIL
ncbi:MAG: glutamate 5-kinase [Candidatus Omnitrophica bacterium]|nr:glutamate 5-kinase [Candidatus Omnitrophota bacterium]